jgi:hypothetical protein
VLITLFIIIATLGILIFGLIFLTHYLRKFIKNTVPIIPKETIGNSSIVVINIKDKEEISISKDLFISM